MEIKKKRIQRINKTRTLLFEKIKNIDIPLAKNNQRMGVNE